MDMRLRQCWQITLPYEYVLVYPECMDRLGEIRARFSALEPVLDERSRRLLVAAEFDVRVRALDGYFQPHQE